MGNIYSSVEVLKFPRSRFKFRTTRRATYGYGKIYPDFIRNCTPGETLQVTVQTMVKVQPMAAPSMTPQRMDVHFFFVPYRLLDENFCRGYIGIADKDFVYEGVSYKKNEEFPYKFPIWSPTADDFKVGSMWDYCGFGINVKDLQSLTPSDIPETGDINAPFYLNTNAKGVEPTEYIPRAYNLIYNTMYRDENLIDEVDLDSKVLQYRSYRPDYFTKALPFQQLPSDVTFALPFQISTDISSISNPKVGLPSENVGNYVTGQVNFGANTGGVNVGIGPLDSFGMVANDVKQYTQGNSVTGYGVSNSSYGLTISQASGVNTGTTVAGSERLNSLVQYDRLNTLALSGANIAASLSANSQITQALTVAETRNAFQLLKEAERTARTGHRFDEYIKAHWGEFPGDARLQLPEFVGGFKVPIIFGESLQTSQSTKESSQGNRVGIGNAVAGNSTHWYHVTEPGLMIGLVSILPRSEYMQGIPKMFQLHDRLDFPRHEFCCLSEQPVKTGELVLSSETNDDVAKAMNETEFGFQGIYNEYRTGYDQTVGQMRTLYQYWHQTRIFDPTKNAEDGKPSTRLNSDFVEARDVSMRTFLNSDDRYDPFNVEEMFVVDTIMPITNRAVPGLVDHF